MKHQNLGMSASHEIIDIGRARNSDGDAIFVDLYLPAGDRVIVRQYPDFVIDCGIQRDDRAASHAEQLLHGKDRAAQDHRYFHIDGINLTQDATSSKFNKFKAPIAPRSMNRHFAANMLDRSLNPGMVSTLFGRSDGQPCEWDVSTEPVDYLVALARMEARVEDIVAGRARELVWLLEHPPLYSAGVSSKSSDLLEPDRFPVFPTGRGGQYTYHGPGQRVAYVMLDLSQRTKDIRAFVFALETWLINSLATLDVVGGIRADRVGVWVDRSDPNGKSGEDKIAAIGIKVRKWVSFHGVSLNVMPDLSHFEGIVPCGQSAHGVTSLQDLGLTIGLDQADQALMSSFPDIFGPIEPVDKVSGHAWP